MTQNDNFNPVTHVLPTAQSIRLFHLGGTKWYTKKEMGYGYMASMLATANFFQHNV